MNVSTPVTKTWGAAQVAAREQHKRDYPNSYLPDHPAAQNDNHAPLGGVCGHSTASPYDSYAIFCVGQSIAKQAAFRAWALNHSIGFKSLRGRYKGQSEASFIVNLNDLDTCASWFMQEESVLILSPMYREGSFGLPRMFGSRKAWLRYQDKHQEYIGLYQNVLRQTAMRHENYTYDPEQNLWFIVLPDNN